MTTVSTTAAMLADSAARILSDHCTPAVLRAADLGGAALAHAHAAVGDSAAAAAAYAAENAPRRVEAALAALRPLWSALDGAGLVRSLAPEGDGGAGLGWADVRGMLEAAGRFAAPVPLADTTAACALARAAGVAPPAGAATLGVARFDDGARRVIAEGVAHASQAQWVACTLPGEVPGEHRFHIFAVEGAVREDSVNIAGEQRSRMSWPTDSALCVGTLPPGMDALVAGAAVRVAQIAGGCARVVELAGTYANTREQFGRPIAKFQALQQQLALAGEWSAMAAMASRLALSSEGLGLDAARVAAAKQVAGTAVETCNRVAHAVHGAIGVTGEYDLQLHTRHLWAWAADFGSSLLWAGVLGRALLAGHEDRVWDEVVRLSAA